MKKISFDSFLKFNDDRKRKFKTVVGTVFHALMLALIKIYNDEINRKDYEYLRIKI